MARAIQTRCRRLVLLVLPAFVLAVAPATAGASVETLRADLERSNFSEFSQTNAQTGALLTTPTSAFSGSVSAHATYSGGGGNGYSRGIWNVEWSDGEEVWFGAAYFLPNGFHSQIQGQVDLLRWDNYSINPSNTDWGGVSIYGSDRRARLLRFGAGRDNDTLVGPLSLPEGRWFTLEVHQRLSASSGSALSELYVDGKLVGSSTAANTYGRPATRIRYGIVAIASGSQQKSLELRFDSASTGTQPMFAEAIAPSPQPEPTPEPEPRPEPAPEPSTTPQPQASPAPGAGSASPTSDPAPAGRKARPCASRNRLRYTQRLERARPQGKASRRVRDRCTR